MVTTGTGALFTVIETEDAEQLAKIPAMACDVDLPDSINVVPCKVDM
jgi:hypothetical protein